MCSQILNLARVVKEWMGNGARGLGKGKSTLASRAAVETQIAIVEIAVERMPDFSGQLENWRFIWLTLILY